ncbi:Myb-like DNA-binding domain containing protein [Trichomonas vaginalis G3]|uniref:Myb-like DNA-binding domain containing protein n=1 Tax=Trichomonas vaginalis (strain ATCC PRA-98 / G3) TaxID=412133 RepID=A2FY69_TRIV3|nr:RNA polymerase II transcription regulator recruiting protein [Trichomonas vaginalis G3]EAX90147.1 Myb-like DNA-binding domain containing protein [Trichomonas vaginalis G3]KAI5550119.1 RNA polymerase II transcription regulator recruiting protein [Trichomonas vaginalis G3]|eukprot:XP_001303077.1 Myb-like DNA-binding domain containing protein [Trichomonas vaginalis G3]
MRAVTKRHFSEKEDTKLSKLVNRIGTSNWKKVSKQMKDRTARQCKDRWEKFLAPELNRGPFNTDEDNLILEKYEQFGPQWTKIASFLSKRSDVAVKARHKYLIRHNIKNTNEKINISNDTKQAEDLKNVMIDNSQLGELSMFDEFAFNLNEAFGTLNFDL